MRKVAFFLRLPTEAMKNTGERQATRATCGGGLESRMELPDHASQIPESHEHYGGGQSNR